MSSRARPDLLRRAAGWFAIAATVVSVWLGWEVVRAALAARAPPELAIRLAPTSPEVLRVAAEAELRAGRAANARVLASESLARAPFNARALRTWGLTEAPLRPDTAVQALTLSGNWSLRDDPSHAWLFEYYLRRGDFGLAFAHLDTLTRRRGDLQPQLFDLLNKAATSDPRGLQALLRLLNASPPWRQLFFEYLQDTVKADGLSATLAISLDKSKGRFSPAEYSRLYSVLADRRQYGLLREVRARASASGAANLVQDPDFDTPLEQQAYPFGWTHDPSPGSSIQIVADDVRQGNNALRVEYDGFDSQTITRQLMLLAPGEYALSGEVLVETATTGSRMAWTVQCIDGGSPLGQYEVPLSRAPGAWRRFRISFRVPDSGCPAQWLALEPDPGDRRSVSSVWFDKVNVGSPATQGQP